MKMVIKSKFYQNGHKIEILSQNKNLCTVSSYSGVRHNKIESNIPCKKNTVYTLTFKDESDLNQSGNRGITLITHKTKTDKNDHGNIYTHATNEGGKEYTFRKSGFTFNTSDCCYISLTSNNMSSVPNLIIKEIQIEEGSQTSYNPQMFNKKEILMNEPLRGLPNGVKDRFVKIGGKWYIERNTEELDMGSVTFSTYALSDEHPDVFGFYYTPSNIIQIGSDNRCICNILPSVYCAFPGIINHNIEGIDVSGSHIKGTIYRSKLTELSSNGLKKYFNEVGAKVLYPLRTPIYEPLEINPELLTYLDATHISNNSLIPCNMKIKNSGYNAIIKPSTLYTITLDTNKSGTIGMNLGGVKGTTTNNVLTLTTPATLTDDSLRLYGKGIKGSKVRLLEGDKTNWIPSHFEGMMSSFEDKFDTTDNTYKMEILSNNKNLLDLNDLILTSYNDHTVEKITNGFKIKSGLNGQWIIVAEFKLRVKPNTSYTLGITKTVIKNAYEGKDSTSWDVGYTWIKTEDDATITEFKLNDNLRNTKTFNTRNNTVIRIRFTTATDKPTTIGEYDFTDISLVEDTVNSKHTQNKYNKIQFSSIEPLRSTKDISDRFIFKDGKIMIERNCIERDLTYFKFSTTEIKGLNLKGGITISDAYRQPQGGANTTMKCDKLASDFKENTIPCINIYHHANQNELRVSIPQRLLKTIDKDGINDYFVNNPHKVIYRLAEPTYEEIPFELQKIILEGYENGTLFFDTNIPPTSTVTYAGETPIVKSVRLNKTEVLNNTNDINDNIVPYLMDMDYRVVCLQLQSENINDGVSMARLFGGAYEMLQRDIQSRRYSVDEYRHRLDAYLGANKITEDEYNKLGDMLNE